MEIFLQLQSSTELGQRLWLISRTKILELSPPVLFSISDLLSTSVFTLLSSSCASAITNLSRHLLPPLIDWNLRPCSSATTRDDTLKRGSTDMLLGSLLYLYGSNREKNLKGRTSKPCGYCNRITRVLLYEECVYIPWRFRRTPTKKGNPYCLAHKGSCWLQSIIFHSRI